MDTQNVLWDREAKWAFCSGSVESTNCLDNRNLDICLHFWLVLQFPVKAEVDCKVALGAKNGRWQKTTSIQENQKKKQSS